MPAAPPTRPVPSHRTRTTLSGAAAVALCLGVASSAQAQTWLERPAHVLPSGNTGWGSLTLKPGTHRLFAARNADGLLAWDTVANTGATVENSRGAAAMVLAPPAGRGYVAMTDGTVLTVELKTLKPLSRADLGAGELGGGVFEPTQNRIHMITAAGPEKSTWVTLDAASGQVLGRTEFNSRKMDTPAVDGRGAIFAPMRDKGLLQQLDAKDLSLVKTWKLGECQQPVAVQWDQAAERILIACRGDRPVFVALNPATGITATLPIGGGVDGMVVDAKRHLIATANGLDATISVIRQDSPDAYSLVETIATRPMARVLQLEEDTGRMWSMTATSTQPVAGADGKKPPPIFHPDTFTILSYQPAN